MRVHPVADLFPMMSDDELADLANDIKINGQIHPITIAVIDGEETLIDGRNRRRACELAGVEPKTQKLNGQDPVAYILSSNDRRDMTQGQRAVVAALATNLYNLYSFGDISNLARALKVPQPRVSEAIIIAKHAPDLAEQVRIGQMPFAPALERARLLKRDTDDNATKMARLRAEAPDLADLAGISLDDAIAKLDQRNAESAQLKTIERDAPDLVRKVTEGHITVTDAMVLFAKAKEDERAAQQGATSRLFQIVHLIDVDVGNYKHAAARLMDDVNPKMWPADRIEDLSATHLKACADMLAECAKHLKR